MINEFCVEIGNGFFRILNWRQHMVGVTKGNTQRSNQNLDGMNERWFGCYRLYLEWDEMARKKERFMLWCEMGLLLDQKHVDTVKNLWNFSERERGQGFPLKFCNIEERECRESRMAVVNGSHTSQGTHFLKSGRWDERNWIFSERDIGSFKKPETRGEKVHTSWK